MIRVKKGLASVVVLLAGAFVAHSQAPMYFANYLYLSPYIYVSLGSTLLGGSNTLTTGVPEMDVDNGNDWTVALWGNVGAGDSSATLEANGNLVTATMENGISDLIPGTWLTTASAVIPGATILPATVSVQLAAWYNDGGTITAYAAAQAAGYPTGLSAIATAIINPPWDPLFHPAGLPSGLGNVVLTLQGGQQGPQLTIIQNGINVVLTWPTNVAGFNLEFATNLASPVFWNTNSSGPVVIGGQNVVTNPMTGSQMFFRLQQ